MATISTSGISALQVIKSEHLLRIINALNGTVSNDIIITGTLNNGGSNTASGLFSHAQGNQTVAIGGYSHAEGLGTVASGSYQHVQGQYNISSSIQSAFIIGNGTSNANRSNLVFAAGSSFQVSGSLNISGSITLNGTSITGAGGAGVIAVSGSSLYSTNPSTSGFSQTSSIFLGSNSGEGATNASNSNFFGQEAGSGSISGYYSNFIGQAAGNNATDANDSNFGIQGFYHYEDLGFFGNGSYNQGYHHIPFYTQGYGVNITKATWPYMLIKPISHVSIKLLNLTIEELGG